MQTGTWLGSATLALVVSTVMLTAFSQIILKIGMSGQAVQQILAEGASILRISWVIGTSPIVVLGLASYAMSAILWLFVLSKADVSVAYPCMALGYVLTFAAGVLLLGEAFSIQKLVGIAAIMAGVAALATSG